MHIDRRKALLKTYVVLVALGAAGAVAISMWDYTWDSSQTLLNGLIAVFAVGIGAELSSISLNIGSSRLSIAFVAYLAGCFLFAPVWAMTLGGASVFAVELFVRHKPAIKVIFNTSKEILSLGLASSAYALVGGLAAYHDFVFRPVPVFAAGVAYAAANSLSVSLAVSLSEGFGFWQAWVRMYAGSVIYDVFAIPVPALLAYLYSRYQLLGVVALAAPLFVVRHIYAMNLRLEQANRDLLELMVKAIEARDPYTSGHSQRVAQYARVLAREAGLSHRQVEHIATAALLHDVGKIYEEYAPLLRKEGKLSPEERSVLQTHPVRSAELVATISSLRGPVSEAVRHHHENFDGTGYPDGRAGEEIPIGARVIMIADTIDAMTTHRPYRQALPFERVVEQLTKYSGSQFDPSLASTAIRSSALRALLIPPGAPLSPPTIRHERLEQRIPVAAPVG